MRTLLTGLIYILIVLFLLPLFLVCILIGKATPIMALGKGAVRLGQYILGIKIDVTGREGIDRKKPYVFMANHQSFLDGPLLFMLIPQPVRIILKKEIFRIPVIGQAMKTADFVPVDRKGVQGGRKSVERAISFVKKNAYSFLIFPEGTRSLDSRLQRFRRGGFFLAAKSGAPIIPIALTGTFSLMPKGTFFIRRGRVKVAFLPEVSVQGQAEKDFPRLMETVRRQILSRLETWETRPGMRRKI
ncbi:MAG: 1-acyl-sn-glycerol-3-phosphate acyltransferase [Candidatus Aminicenantes bacterium]|nr:1-acyl-sn-glycerol-3-phosphate acyltransferase [Candidatus Aminicenantes bacterium]